MTDSTTLSDRLRSGEYRATDLIAAAERIDRLEAALLLIAVPRVGGGQWASEIAKKVMGLDDDGR